MGGGKKKIAFYRRLTNPAHFSKGLLYSKQISSTVATDLPTSSKKSENISEIKTVEQPLIVEDFGAQVGEKVDGMSDYQSFCREIQEWAETFQNEVSE